MTSRLKEQYNEQIAKELEVDFYFAKPYHSWQRGSNENLNRLIRQYFPKGTDFRMLSQSDIDKAVERINHRPRKTLGFKTAAQMMEKTLSDQSFNTELHL